MKAWGAGGSKYVWGCPSEFQSMDPHAIYDVTTENIRLNIYDHLYRYLDNPPKIHPWLADNDAGSGSYVLESYSPGVGWTAKRF